MAKYCFRRVVIDSRLRRSHSWPLHIGDLESWSAKDRWLSEIFLSSEINQGSFDLAKLEKGNSIKLKYFWMRVSFLCNSLQLYDLLVILVFNVFSHY